MTLLRSFFLAMALITVVHSFQVAVTPPNNAVVPVTASRRDFFANSFIFAGILGFGGEEAEASARGYHISRKIKAQEAHTREHAPEQALPSGVAIQEFFSGRSGFEVRPDSLVTAEIRLAGARKPTTQKFRMGTGKLLAGLEEGLLGMNLHGARRIIVPPELVKEGKEQGQLPLPQMDSSLLEQWFAEAASALSYEVQVIALN